MYASKKYSLRYRKDDETWKEIPLIGNDFVIGSGEQAYLQLADKGISPVHFRLELKPDGFWLTDLDSESGTILEGQRLTSQTPVRLESGQSFQVGDYFLTLFEVKEQSVEEERAGKFSTKSVEKLASRQPWLRWALDHAALVSGIVAGIALVSLAIVFFVNRQQNAQVTAINQTASAAPVVMQSTGTPLTNVTTSAEPTITQTVTPFVFRTVQPSQSAAQLTIVPPGLGNIQIDPISLLSNGEVIENLWQTLLTISSGQSVDINTVIKGTNIGFIYRYAGMRANKPDGTQAFQTIEMQYLSAKSNQEIGGVLIPDWGGGEIPINFNWKPTLTKLGNGTQWESALIYPISYATMENVKGGAYATNGRYSYLDHTQVPSKIIFNPDGKMVAIYGYKESEGFRGTPFEIVPQPGEQFTVLLQEFEFEPGEQLISATLSPELTGLLAQATALPFGQLIGEAGIPGYGMGSFTLYEGGTLTYQGMPFQWQKEENVPGDYAIGIIVEDLDGNFLIAYVPIHVQ